MYLGTRTVDLRTCTVYLNVFGHGGFEDMYGVSEDMYGGFEDMCTVF